jgi:signal transduction histidine kinase
MDSFRILLLEDSKTFCFQLQEKIKQQWGFEVVPALTLAEARGALERNDGGYALAIVDLHLPDALASEGVDLVKEFGVPCIVFTSSPDEEIRQTVLAKGVIDYFRKTPSQFEALVAFVGRLHKNREIKILVVDDSRVRCFLTKEMLRLYFFQVVFAENGHAALNRLAQEPDISLVVTDFNMPGMDGLNLTTAIRETRSPRDTAIIGISAIDSPILATRFLKAGADDFLYVPFQKEELYCRLIRNIENLELIRDLKKVNLLKDQFLAIAAHDLRNPLSAIKGFSTLLIDERAGKVSEKQKEYLDIISRSCLHMISLVNDLLDISVIEAGQIVLDRKNHDLGKILTELSRNHESAAERKGIAFEVACQAELIFACDSLRISQVFDNLIGNAVKFSPQGTSIRIDLGLVNSSIIFSVEDQGQGIGDEEREDLFKPFKKLSARPTGGESSTGLGLAIVHNLVEAHGGKIEVISKKGEGTIFRVIFPRS